MKLTERTSKDPYPHNIFALGSIHAFYVVAMRPKLLADMRY